MLETKDVTVKDFTLPTRYAINKILGYGTYGVVAEAYDNLENKKVATKRLNPMEDLVLLF